jgi:hypothetical protein
MEKITYSVCKPNKQIKSWHILKFTEPNCWHLVAYIREPVKHKDTHFTKIMENLSK